MTLIAFRDTWMLTSRISSVSAKDDRACAAASATVCEYCPRAKRLVKALMMPNGSPGFGNSKALRLITLKNPDGPSKTRLGPVMPACASWAENIALRLASADAKSFQLDRVSARPWLFAV